MTNFEKIKGMDRFDLAVFLSDIGCDNTPWVDWFDKNYCQKCPTTTIKESNGHECEYAFCELNDYVCRHFLDLGEVPDDYQIAKLWLEAETE